MASLLKKIVRIYDGIRVLEKAEATTQRDMARIAREKRELARRESQAERGWRVNP